MDLDRKRPLLKKAAQKFLLLWGMGGVGDNAHAPALKSFFASFCSQKEVLPFASQETSRKI
ncbi:hypothetical protein [Acidocella sp.]|jgi:hypothetical protein|uniref:hypothetical protein n=1 Tax=Acidocella sp. TaxID=50710 RepID=UPI002F40AD9E